MQDDTEKPELSEETSSTPPEDTAESATEPTVTEDSPEEAAELPEEPNEEAQDSSEDSTEETQLDTTPEAAVETPDAPVANPDANKPVVPAGSSSKGKLLLGILVTVIVLGGVAGGIYKYYSNHHHKTVAAATKKDIPLINYGMLDNGPSDTYPNSLNTSGAAQINSQMYEGLVGYHNESKVEPLLATSWVNPDNQTWVFTLRQGVKFHTGRTMTADDVKYSLDYAVAHQADQDSSLVLELASTIKSVTVVDSSHVKIITDGPDPTLLNRLTWLYILDSKAKLGDLSAGTGPYVVKPGTTPTQTDTQLVASSDYWGGHVYTKAIHFQTVTDPDKLTSDFSNGKFDIAGQLPDNDLAKLQQKQTVVVPDFYVYFLGLNTLRKGSPFTSLAARQAAAYAMNVPAIMKAGGITGTQASQLIPAAIPGYDNSIQNTPFDLAKAKSLLASAPNANAQISMIYPAARQSIADEITKELTAAGFNVKATSEPDVGSVVNLGLSGKSDIYFLGYSSDILDGLDVIQSVITGNDNYSNKTVDALADQASSTLEPTARIALLQKIEQQVAADEPNVPLYAVNDKYALGKPYHVVVDIPGTLVGSYFWQVYQ